MAKSQKDTTAFDPARENDSAPETSSGAGVEEVSAKVLENEEASEAADDENAQVDDANNAEDASDAVDGGDASADDSAGDTSDADTQAADEANINAFEELFAAKAEAQDWQDKYLRLHAEWDTYRRRMNEQRADEKAKATEKLMEDLLPVIDDFERTIDYAEKNGEAGLLGGVNAVHSKFVDMLTKHGLQTINPEGEPYNALEAQAVATVPNTDVYDETVAEVYQKGYRLGSKVLRSAMVTVTTGGPTRPAEEASEEE